MYLAQNDLPTPGVGSAVEKSRFDIFRVSFFGCSAGRVSLLSLTEKIDLLFPSTQKDHEILWELRLSTPSVRRWPRRRCVWAVERAGGRALRQFT